MKAALLAWAAATCEAAVGNKMLIGLVIAISH